MVAMQAIPIRGYEGERGLPGDRAVDVAVAEPIAYPVGGIKPAAGGGEPWDRTLIWLCSGTRSW